jgi:alpha-L-rhamnosidase
MNSFNHYAFGSVGEWMYRTVGGIDSDGPGYRKIIIRPKPGTGLTWANVKYDSINGLISSDWKIEGGKLTLNVTIPPNTTATIYVPTKMPVADENAQVHRVGSGSYTYSMPW